MTAGRTGRRTAPGWPFSRAGVDGSDAGDTDGIWLFEIESGKGLRVASGELSVPTWSPDGNHLAAWDNESGRIVIFGRDGSDLTTVRHEPRRFIAPRWIGD